jgi:acyl carrier protein
MAAMTQVADLPDPGDDAALAAWVLARIEAAADIYARPQPVPPSAATLLEGDLGIDSIGRISLFYEVADALGADADEEEERGVAGWRSLGDVVAFVRRRLEAR